MAQRPGDRVTVYLNHKARALIKDYAEQNELSVSEAIRNLAFAGLESQGENSSKVEDLENKINELEQKISKRNTYYDENIYKLKKKLENITDMMTASRIGDIRGEFIWEEDNPPQKAIPIHLWFDPSNPNNKQYEKYGLTSIQLIHKMFGVEGERLFNNWCSVLDIYKNEQRDKRIKYLIKISGATHQQVKLPNQSRKTNRFVINHLFPKNYDNLFEKE